MVSKPINQRKTVKKSTKVIYLTSLSIIVAFIVIGIGYIINNLKHKTETAETIPEESIIEPAEIVATEPVEITPIDFQPIIDQWVSTTNGNKSIFIYDLDRNEIAGQYNISEKYNTASLYKLFVTYEGYRRIQNGSWDPNAPAGNTGYTISKCLDLSIRESHSECAESLWRLIGHAELDDIIKKDFDINNSDISNLISNVEDVAKIMHKFYLHAEILDTTLINQIKDSFLVQPTTTYNWRQGLPSGFTRANVYNKVGWQYNPDGRYWEIYHDSAIVEIPEKDRHFIVVVMTNRIDFAKIRQLGTMIEDKLYQ